MAVMDDLGVAPLSGLRTPEFVRLAVRLVGSVVDGLDAGAVGLRDVGEMWGSFDRIERLAAAAKVLLAGRVEESGEWRRAGARSAAEHLGRLAGVSTTEARRSLASSKELAELPALVEVVRRGVLSGAQVAAIVPAARADPGAVEQLVDRAATTNVTELRETCLRVRAAADPDPEATHARIHASRCLRTFTDAEGAWNLHARGTVEDGARFEHLLAPLIDERFQAARTTDVRERREVYAFDALMSLTDQEPPTRRARPKPRYLSLLHVSYEALVRGSTTGEETCEIVGMGPVPVRVARDLLGESVLKLVLTKGVDVAHVVHLGRGPTAAQRIALLWTAPKCANVECSSSFVQIDHRAPWATTQHTRLDELDPLCPHDHALKTHHQWELVNGTGRRTFVAPTDPRHPRHKPPPP